MKMPYPRTRLLATARLALAALATALLPACGGDGTGANPATVARVDLSRDSATLAEGATLQLTAVPRDAGGRPVQVQVTWSSSDTTVATVAGGLVTARGSGEALVSATAGPASAQLTVRVPGIRVVARPADGDTVDAEPAQPLVVELRGPAGLPAAGVMVQLQSVMVPSPPGCVRHVPVDCGPVPSVQVTAPGWTTFDSNFFVQTGSDGRITLRLKMGEAAGPGGVFAHVFGGPVQKTVPVTVKAGAAARFLFTPADTAVRVGATYTLGATVADRHGNPRSDAFTLAAANGRTSVAGATVTGVAVGRGAVVAQTGAVTDTARVSVVPPGTLAVFLAASLPADSASLLTVATDGSGRHRVVRSKDYYGSVEMVPAWSADGTRLVFSDVQNINTTRPQLWVSDLVNAPVALPPGSWYGEFEPSFSPDGQWIYYSTSVGAPDWLVRRVHPDGTGVEDVVGRSTSYGAALQPSTSPDGTQLLYSLSLSEGLLIQNLGTHATRVLDGSGFVGRWSPVGGVIAYIPLPHGGIWTINADGTGAHAVSPPGHRYEGAVQWSPDGKYVISRESNSGLLEIVDVATGEAIPLPFSRQMRRPAWKP